MDSDKINKGNRITKKFPAGQFSELEVLRKTVNLLLDLVDLGNLTEEEKIVYNNFLDYNSRVEELK